MRYPIANVDELSEDGSHVLQEIEGIEIAVYRIDGEYFAIANYCVHQGGPLCEGELRGKYGIGEDGWEWTFDSLEKNAVCPWHGWKFDVTTGENLDDDQYIVPTYDVEVENDTIYVLR